MAVILLTSLVASNIPPILASLWHFSTILSIQVCSSHGIFLILDKWVQVCLASTGTTPVLEPIRLLFMAAFIGLWTTSTIAGHVHLLTQLSWEDQITAKFFNDFSRSYYIPILIVSIRNEWIVFHNDWKFSFRSVVSPWLSQAFWRFQHCVGSYLSIQNEIATWRKNVFCIGSGSYLRSKKLLTLKSKADFFNHSRVEQSLSALVVSLGLISKLFASF